MSVMRRYFAQSARDHGSARFTMMLLDGVPEEGDRPRARAVPAFHVTIQAHRVATKRLLWHH